MREFVCLNNRGQEFPNVLVRKFHENEPLDSWKMMKEEKRGTAEAEAEITEKRRYNRIFVSRFGLNLDRNPMKDTK